MHLALKNFWPIAIANIFYCFFLGPLHASEGNIIAKLLERLSDSSPQLSINSKKTKAQNLTLGKSLNQLKYTSSFDINRSQSQPAPTSPFVADEREENVFSLNGSKLWPNGLRANLIYSVRDSNIEFGNRNFAFLSPTLELQLNSRLFQDVLGKRYEHMVKNVESQNSYNNLQDRIFRKGVLVKALLEFASILENKEELSLQKSLCQKTKIQFNKLSQKRKRFSASKREYLQSRKEYNNCRALIQNLEKLVIESKSDFEANYFVGLDPFLLVNSDQLFKEVQTLYQGLNSNTGNGVDVNKQDDVKLLALQLAALGEKQSELDAMTKSDLNVEFRVGSTGADISFPDASSDVFGLEYPFIFAGISLDLPLKNRNSSADAAANMYQIKAAQEQKKLTVHQKENRIKTLFETLQKDFEIYKRYSESVSIGKQILSEANKDYTNGRIDYNSYTEFNKSLIQDQKVLSSHRIRVIIRAIEFLDFFQFFDAYVGGAK